MRRALYEKGTCAPDFNLDKRKKRKIIVEVAVNMSNGKKGKLVIHEGDDPIALCHSFGTMFQLPIEAINNLIQEVTRQLISKGLEI